MPAPEAYDAEARRDTGLLAAYAIAVVVAAVALVAACAWDRYPAPPAARGTLAVRGAAMFDGRGGPAVDDAVVVVDGDRITCAGAGCRVPDGARIIDATGLAVLPGLVDLDVHFGLTVVPERSRAVPLVMWDYARLLPAERRALLEAGVTSVRELGNIAGMTRALERGLAAGQLAGPRVHAVGPTFTAPMGIPVATLAGNVWVIEHATRQVSDPDAARREVRRLAEQGFDGVGAVCDAGFDGRLPRVGPAVLSAIVDEAHARGLWAAVNTGRVQEVRDAAEAGADTIQHGPLYDGPLPADVVALLRARGLTYVPSLAAAEAFLLWVERSDRPEDFPAASWDDLRRALREAGPSGPMAQLLTTVRTAAAAGVRIGAGTAGGTGLGESLHRELELLVAAGLSPADALLAATRDAAVALRAERELGTLEPGKLADLVLVAGRPWERIADVRAVRLVIQAGRVVVDRQ